MTAQAEVLIENPIINSLSREPDRQFAFDECGITNEIVPGRRRSSYFIPIAGAKKTKSGQIIIDTEWTKDRIEENKFINSVREKVRVWRENGLPLDPGTPSPLFNKIQKQSNLRHTRLHHLRHLPATELWRLGEPLHVVAERLGHRDAMVKATIYAHVSNEQAETASSRFAEATKLAK